VLIGRTSLGALLWGAVRERPDGRCDLFRISVCRWRCRRLLCAGAFLQLWHRLGVRSCCVWRFGGAQWRPVWLCVRPGAVAAVAAAALLRRTCVPGDASLPPQDYLFSCLLQRIPAANRASHKLLFCEILGS